MIKRIKREIKFFIGRGTAYEELIFVMDYKTEPIALLLKKLIKKLIKKKNVEEELKEEL